MNIAVVFGGSSYEHEISIVSAITLKNILEKSFELSFIFIDSEQEMYLISEDKMQSQFFANREYQKSTKLNFIQSGFQTQSLFAKKMIFDVALNLVHGATGEDGTLASIFDFYKIKFIGPRKEASVFSFNKYYTKIYAQSIGVKTLEYEVLNINDERKLTRLSYPVIVKPVTLGSSIGIAIVKNSEELNYALDTAFEFDDSVIIEPFKSSVREFNLAGTLTDKIEFSLIEEPSKQEILDFDKKYLDFSRDEKVVKSDISTELEEKLKDNFQKIYGNIFAGSLIRCDFFIIDDEVYLNEINPIPGSMTNYLFSDFEQTLTKLISFLPKVKRIPVEYKYINSLKSAKG
jgi:D-alanine-D-alanine ligase